jgi:DNA-binding response OmpR family regulator
MQDKDAANTMPGGGIMGVVNGISSEETRIFVSSPLDQQEQPKISPRILVVEDDISLAHLEANFLAAHACTVVIAGNGELAITAIDNFMPDLVVLDLELPGSLTGWDVLQVLRQNTQIPVLLTTSLTLDLRKHLRTSGESRSTLDHLPKPYAMQALLKRVRRMLMIVPQ